MDRKCQWRWTRDCLLRFIEHRSCLSGLSVHASNHLLDPRAEGRHFGVDAGRLLSPAGVAPRCDSINHPPPSRTLAHQWPAAVTTTTVHTSLRMRAAGTEHATCECTMEMLLAEATGQQGECRLLKGLGVWMTWERCQRSSQLHVWTKLPPNLSPNLKITCNGHNQGLSCN